MRKRKPKKRTLAQMHTGSAQVTSFVNNLMWQGKKGVAYELFYDAMDTIKERTGNRAVEKSFNKCYSRRWK